MGIQGSWWAIEISGDDAAVLPMCGDYQVVLEAFFCALHREMPSKATLIHS